MKRDVRTGSAPRLPPEPLPIAALLERSSPARARAPEGFPPHLWEQALLGPLREFLRRPGKQLRGQLVELGHALAGGAPGSMPPELPLLIELLHAGSLIIDDIEDGSASRRGSPTLHALVGTPLALNAGNWLYFWPFELLSAMDLPPGRRLRAHDLMHACLARCHEGQALDLVSRVTELDQAQVPAVVERVTSLKTGSLVGLSMALGATVAGAPTARVRSLQRLGHALGVALQMLDDLSGVVNPSRHHKGAEDLLAESPTWVWAWLARDLDAASYREHVAELASVVAGEGDAGVLLSRLSFRLGVTARSRVRRQVARALGRYRASDEARPELEELRSVLERLERSYVAG